MRFKNKTIDQEGIKNFDWAAFGRAIYDAAAKSYFDRPFPVIIPIKIGSGTVSIKIESPICFYACRSHPKKEDKRQFKHGVLFSNGKIKWEKWR